jgi:hypothetical protein
VLYLTVREMFSVSYSGLINLVSGLLPMILILKREHRVSETGSVSVLRLKCGVACTPLGPIVRAIHNQWIISPVDGSRSVSEMWCSIWSTRLWTQFREPR